MADKPDITPELLRQLLRYEPDTGLLFWHTRSRVHFKSDRDWRFWNTRFAGKQTFQNMHRNGYYYGCIFRKDYTAHRVAYAHYHGTWPEGSIDHIDHDRKNNRISNLRSVSIQENSKNRKQNVRNTSGHNGVTWKKYRKKWEVQIGVNGKATYVGMFTGLEDAISAREEANKRYLYHANHGVSHQLLKGAGND